MRLSKAIILLRIWREEAISYLQKHPELGIFNESDDFELNDKQYLYLYKQFSDDFGERKVSTIHGYYHDEYNKIILGNSNDNIYVQNKQIEIGMILQCRGGRENFGIIIGLNGSKLYYFEKKEELSIPTYNLVTFIVNPIDSNKADYVINFADYEIIGDGDISEREAMQRKIPYVKMSRYVSTISFFVSKKIDVYYKFKLCSDFLYVIDLYWLMKALEFIPEIELDDINKKILELKKYLSNFDEKKVINTYKVIQDGHLQRRVGRDDHFIMTTTRSVDSDDTYIHSLLPIGENSNHYSTNSDEENYNYIDEEATKDDIDIALAKYDRDEHFAFLLKEYMDCHYEISQRKVEVNIYLKGMFNLKKFRSKIKSLFFYHPHYKKVVNQYNNQ